MDRAALVRIMRLAKATGRRPSELLYGSAEDIIIDLECLNAFDKMIKDERDKIRRRRGKKQKDNCYAFDALPELMVPCDF